ncbi:ABC transporter permease [Aurantivibrio plasticivorans]
MLGRIAGRSLWSRRGAIALTIFSIALSTAILSIVEHVRVEAKNSFGKTVSSVDLIVGARTGQLNLLLYSVFRMGSATNNIDYSSYQDIVSHPQVAWSIPISLGDSHRGYRVMGTTSDYFEHFKYGQQQPLEFSSGVAFTKVFGAVLGYEVAQTLGYRIGDNITLQHGIGSTSFVEHNQNPFTVVGILSPTGTPVDRTVHISLAGLEAIHLGWSGGVQLANSEVTVENFSLDGPIPKELQPESITAFMLGLRSKVATFSLQRQINNFSKEPLTALLPGVALAELWQMMAMFEQVLQLIALLVLVAALFGMAAVLLTALRERKQELLLLRTLGASPRFILLFVECEVLVVTAAGLIAGFLSAWCGLLIGRHYLESEFGLFISGNMVSVSTLIVALSIFAGGLIIGILPAVAAYRVSLKASR